MTSSEDNTATTAAAAVVSPPAESDARSDLPRRVLDNLLEGLQVISPEFRYLYVNDAVVRQGQSTRAGLIGRTMMECYPGIEQTEMFATLRRCMDDRLPAAMENEFTFPNGSQGWFELRFEPVPEGVTILSLDITGRKRAEASLRRAMRALTTLTRCNQTLVRASDEIEFVRDVCRLVVDPGGYPGARIEVLPQGGDGAVDMVARAGVERTSHESSDSCVALDIRSQGKIAGVLTILVDHAEQLGAGERAVLEEVAQDLGFGLDTLRRRVANSEIERQLAASQRLEAVGRLAGGIAHDFNNLMSVILTCCAFIEERLDEGDPIRQDAEQIRLAGERAAGLTRQLLAFSRRQVMAPQVTDLNAVITGVEGMLTRLLGEDIEVVLSHSPGLGSILADPGQLEQVIMNLVINARDAMPFGGKLTIETHNADFESAYVDDQASLKPGRYVCLTVADSGEGMTREVHSRIFEPFFTTKGMAKGTGLGLAVVFGIVKQSGGEIWAYSEVGRGTAFKIYFPRIDNPSELPSPTRPTVRGTSSGRLARGNETVLLVEDDPAVRRAIERILTSAGYRVVCASGGEEALRVFLTREGPMDLLLTDVVMPDMSGKDLANRLREACPQMRVLFTSGYTQDAVVHQGVLTEEARFVGKPFSLVDLTHKVREALDAS